MSTYLPNVLDKPVEYWSLWGIRVRPYNDENLIEPVGVNRLRTVGT